MRREIRVSVLLILSVILAGCQNAKKDTKTQSRISVGVEKVTRKNVEKNISFHGDILAEQEIKVYSKVPDRIKAYHVDEGDYVAKGGIIAEITAVSVEQAVKQAEAALSAARAQKLNMQTEYDRANRLKEEDAISQQQFDAICTQFEAVSAQMEQAQAGLISAQSLYSDTRISAPISGIIGKRYYENGDMANPAMPVVTIVQMNRVKISMDVSETDYGLLSRGQLADVRVAAYPDRVFTGKVSKISPVLDSITRMATVEVLVENPGQLLKPGMYADLNITVGIISNALVVPRHSVIESTSMKKIDGNDAVVKNYFVYVAKDSTAEQRQLDVTYVNHRYVVLQKGVEEGESVVVSGQNNLRDGMPILIVEMEE